jgi:UcrQ family
MYGMDGRTVKKRILHLFASTDNPSLFFRTRSTVMAGDYNENTWWLSRHKGIYTYGLSPFYQKAFLGSLHSDWRAFRRWMFGTFPTLAIFSGIGLGVVYWADYKHHQLTRKNLNDFYPGEKFEDANHH